MLGFNFFLICGLFLIAINIVLTIIIISRLEARGAKINWIFIRLFYPKYVHQYKELIKKETGNVPALFYAWLISINSALVLCVIGIILK